MKKVLFSLVAVTLVALSAGSLDAQASLIDPTIESSISGQGLTDPILGA